ncbi:MAG: CehA/McbA family metallohydrolase [Actinobacteria bacterium]|nr:CehA/McbA family metallohydrolase [Actinomycetota bacterium]
MHGDGAHLGDPFKVDGAWYRGNLHMHSTASDGAWPVERAVGWYRERGYHFIALTDHRVVTDTARFRTPEFVTLAGIEMDGFDPALDSRYYLLGVGMRRMQASSTEWSREEAGQRVRDDGGVVIVPHPYWIGWNARHLAGMAGFVGLEVFNSVCERTQAKGDAGAIWDDYLDNHGLTWGLAADDAHWKYQEEGRGWVMVRAPELAPDRLLHALRQGHFYASQGPAIVDVRISPDTVDVACSPVRRISVLAARMRGRTYWAQDGSALTGIAHARLGAEKYLRVEVEDTQGRRAWTNPQRV